MLGSQRSGTNALRQSLSLDPYVRGFNERKSDELYEDWKLRPEAEIRSFLAQQPRTVLLKPIKSVIDRPLADFLAEFADYRLKVAWIYRDPVLVFVSRRKRWSYLDDLSQFVEEWNRVNRSALDAGDPRVAVVSYADLIADPPRIHHHLPGDEERRDRTVFGRLARFLGARGEYLFRGDSSRAYDELRPDEIRQIQQGTAATLADLEAARSFAPEPVV